MIDQGIVHSVQIVTLGSRLAAAAAIGATTLVVDDVTDFNEDGGTLLLNGVQYAYTSADFDTDTITLATGLTAAAAAVDRVDVWPLTPEKQALVMTTGAEDALTVRVPHSLMALMPEGIRDEGARESVQYSLDNGEFVITDVVGKEPVLDGSYIDPTTLPPNPSDGLPPASSPTPTADGGIGSMNIRWTPIANHDAVTYKVHVGTSSGFTPGPGSLVHETMGSSFNYLPSPVNYGATYYVKIVASDEDGDAPASAEASAQPRQASGPDIAASYGYFGNIAVNQLTGGTLAADVLLSSTISTATAGARVEVGPFGIVTYDSAGTPSIVLPTGLDSAAAFNGDVEARGLTVTGAMALRSTENEVSAGGALVLQAAITAPQSPPSAVVDWDYTTLPGLVDPNTVHYGLWYEGGFFYTVDSDGGVWRSTYPDSGSTQVVTLAAGNQHDNGIVRLGTKWYTLGIDMATLGQTINRYSSTGALELQVAYALIAPGSGSLPRLCTDGTNLLVAERDAANSRFRVQTRSPSTLAVTSTMNTASNASFTGSVVAVLRGDFDFGAAFDRTIIVTSTGGYYWSFDAAGNYQPNESWAVPVTGMSGAAWDGTRFYCFKSQGSRIYKHTTHKWTGTDPQTRYTAATWRDTNATGGVHETTMSPVGPFSMKKRARLTLTSPSIPGAGGTDEPNAVSFYLSNTTNARTSLWRQTLPADGVNTIVLTDAVVFTGTNPPTTNNFPAATPGTIVNANGTMVISGAGTIESPAITQAGVPVATTTGSQTVTNKNLSSTTNTFPTFPYIYARQASASASWPNAAWTNVTTWTVDAFSGITHSAGTFTVAQAGRYRVFGHLSFAANATGVRGVTIVINGTQRAAFLAQATTVQGVAFVSMAYALAAGDTVAIQGYQSSGTTATTLLGDANGAFTNCQIEYVGP